MISDSQYKIILEAVDKTKPAFKRINKSMQGVDKQYKKSVKKIKKDTKSLNKSLKTVEPTLKSIGKVGAVAFLTIGAGIASSVNEAGYAEGAMAKFNVVFGQYSKDVAKRFDELRTVMPLARHEIYRMGADLQDLLVPLGLSRESASKMSGDILELANKVALFNDTNPAEVVEAFRSGLTGSSEPLKRFGIDASISALEAVALSEGLIKAGSSFAKLDPAMRKQVQAQALLIQATKQSSDAINGFESNLDTYTTRMSNVKATIKDLKVVIGSAFLPAVDEALKKVLPIALAMGKWAGDNKELVKVLGEVALSVSALAVSIGILTPVVNFFGKSWVRVGAILTWLRANPLAGIITWAVWFAGALKELISLSYGVEITWKDVWSEIVGFMAGIKDKVVGFFTELTSGVWGADNAIKKLITFLNPLTALSRTVGSVVSVAKNAYSGFRFGQPAPRFATGGVVGGAIGAPVPALVHGGEEIIPYHRRGRGNGGGVTVNINGGIFANEDGARMVGDHIVEALRTQFRF